MRCAWLQRALRDVRAVRGGARDAGVGALPPLRQDVHGLAGALSPLRGRP